MLPSRNKTFHDVRGSKIKCINYQKCPLCYGCRRYSSIDPECRKCAKEDYKFNICNKDLHKDEITARFITKEVIKLDNKISFKSRR